MVVSNGKTKIAQYGQWDGYPDGQGVVALKFLANVDYAKFVIQLDKCKFIDEEKQKEIDEFLDSIGCSGGWMNMDQSKQYKDRYPYLSRDLGAEILQRVNDSEDSPIWLSDGSSFAGRGLYCEWAYVIDLDKKTFEVYKGFGKEPLTDDQRFAYLNEKSEYGYYPVSLVKSYSLDELPTEENFVSEIEDLTKEEED